MRIPYLLALLTAAVWLSASASAQSGEEQDFVPGEKVVFYDDYSDVAKGAAPPHWKVRGASVRLGPDTRLHTKEYTQLFANLKALPKNFTVESEIFKSEDGGYVNWRFEDPTHIQGWIAGFQLDPGEVLVSLNLFYGGFEPLGSSRIKVEYGKPIKLAIWYQDARIRLYVNNEKAIDVNQVEHKPFSVAYVNLQPSDTGVIQFGATRIAESAPDISQVLVSTGKFVSHGIQFDVNSDQLRPESINVIKQVATALEKQAAMKVRIEGHTDSTGDAARNLDLSKRRAESVKNALAKLGISAERLTTEGFGQNKPISSNDTPQGRAENRRVEFVKI